MSLGFSLSSSDPAWSIQGSEKVKYENIFDSLGPVAGKLSGEVVRPVLMNSKLPVDTLGKVWELSDIDKDGFLDRDEFCVAMHLVYRAIEKEPVPASLSLELLPPSKRSLAPIATTASNDKKLPVGAVAVLPPMPSSPALSLSRHGSTSSSVPGISPKHSVQAAQTTLPPQWIVSQADRMRFSGIFQQKKDPDGLISGATARDVFVQSGLPQPILAHVWGMCDNQHFGKLRADQFVLAMHLISQKVKGIELPTQITPEMFSQTSLDSGFGDTGSISDGSSGIGDSAAIRELDALNQEIEELRREKEALTAEIQQKEVTIKNVNNEVQELQDTLDRDSSSLAQLECDKAEAHTRLEELEQQRNKLDSMLSDARIKLQEENENIKSLRAQIAAQEASVNQQETDLRKIRNDLAELKQEETQLEQRLEAGKQQQENISRTTKQAQTEITQVQSQIKQLQDQEKNVKSNIDQYDNAIAAIKSESNGDFSFDAFTTANTTIGISESVFSMGGLQEKVDDIQKDLSEDPFKDNPDPFKTSDPFEGSDPFSGADPFGTSAPTTTTSSTDPFAGSDPFASSSTTSAAPSDPFQSSETPAFASEPFPAQTTSSDPFSGQDPFANNASSTSAFDQTPSSTFSTDPFGTSDIFSSSANSTMNKSNTPKPSSLASGKETTTTSSMFDTGSFASAFADNKDSGSMFKDIDTFPKTTSKENKADPWGSAFGGSGKTGAENDPFGGDSFIKSSSGGESGADLFGDAFGAAKPDKKAPPRPAKPDDMTVKGTESKQGKHGGKHKKPKSKEMSEAEQLAWAQEESRKAEAERLRKQRQEQEDLELAIKLSQQDGN
uniref:Epidermal growth factor receptor substrate 15-like 1 n=1 Tax=Phallusia mammillata TaxID=59560 RepID=A0A6F9DC84_9ASCI|nr:epidermal growth factor receptor substrate 15-like 1 [Phallusia mammillata]